MRNPDRRGLCAPKPRALFLSFKVRYINPTRQLLHSVLSKACDLTTFGPGYVPLDIVADGPEKFAERHGPFDIVICDEYAVLRDVLPPEQKHLLQFYYQAADFDPLLIHEGNRYYAFLKSFRGPRVVSLLASDYYNLSEDFVAQLEEIGDYFVCWGREFVTSKSPLSLKSVAGQPLNVSIVEKWNDRYYDFVSRRADRVLSTPHFVDESEIGGPPLRRRSFDWSVLGADYESRVKARSLIDGAGLSRSGRHMPYLFSAFDRMGFHPYNKTWAIALLNGLFRRALTSARFGFTCGSALRWPIRKYFEIPASAAVLASERCNGFSELGFVSKINALETEPDHVRDANAWLTADLDRAQAIADAGLALVRDKHSVGARTSQLAESFTRIMSGTFAGSFWSGGELKFREAPAIARAAQ